jgi:PAS domain S-box-containing protein
MAEAAFRDPRGAVAAPRPGLSGAPVAILVVDDEGQVAEASLAACRLLGVSRQEVLGAELPDLLSPAAAERLRLAWPTLHEEGGHAGSFELPWGGGGAPVDMSVTASVLPGRHLVLLEATGAEEPAASPATSGARRTALRSAPGPTAREKQILAMLAAGDTDVQVAATLGLAPATVQTHVRNAKAKLGARTRAQAVAMALREGLIEG